MELRQLKNFLVIAELQNVNRAAARLHVAQPALSRQIQHLEAEVGVRLFVRDGRRIRLSAEGAVFLEEARAILAHVDAARNRVAMAAKGIVGVLRVGFHQVAGRHRFVAEAVSAFRRENPSIEIELSPLPINAQIELLQTRGLDAGIFYMPYPIPELAFLRLETNGWAVALPRRHRLARRRTLLARDLQQESFIAIDNARAPRQLEQLQAACQIAGLRPRVVQKVQEEAMLLNLVSVGMGVGFVIDSGYRPSGVVVRKVSDIAAPQQFCLAWRSDNHRADLERLIDTVRRVAPERAERIG